MVHHDSKLVFVFLVITSNLVYSAVAASLPLTNDFQPFLDAATRRDTSDDNWAENVVPFAESSMLSRVS